MKPLVLTVGGFVVSIILCAVGLGLRIPELAFGGACVAWYTPRRALKRTKGNAAWRRFRRYAVSSQGRALFTVRSLVGVAAVSMVSGASSAAMVASTVFLVANVAVTDSIRRSYGKAFRSDILLSGNEELKGYLKQWRWFDTTSEPFTKVVRRLRTSVAHGEPLLWAVGFVAAITNTERVLTIGAIVVAVVAVVALLVDIAKIATAVRKKVFFEKRRRTLEAINRLEPQIAVYFSASSRASIYQISQWVPTLEATGRSIVLITREQHMMRWLQRLSSSIPVVWVRALKDLEQIAPDTIEVVCYVNNAVKNGHMVRRIELTHVQLLHGESDKQSSASRASTAFDRVAVAGQAAIDRYRNNGIHLPPEQYMVVGRPATDVLHRGPTENEVPCILYAPTWEGHDEAANTSSISPEALEIVRFILREYPHVQLLFKPHPLTGSRDTALKEVLSDIRAEINQAKEANPDIGHSYVAGPRSRSLYAAFDACDVLLADVSSVIADFLATDRPMIVFDTHGVGAEALALSSPTSRGSAICAVTPEAVGAALDDAFGADVHSEERLASRRYILGDFEGTATDKFRHEIDELLGGPLPVVDEPGEDLLDDGLTYDGVST